MFGTTSFDQPFAYTGREWDAATGLYHYRARAYDAETGRFLQEDPIGLQEFDPNPYRYARLNPLTYTDPTGFVAAFETGGLTQVVGTAPQIASVGIGLACLFNTIAASVEFEHNFFDEETQGLQKCGGKVVERGGVLAGGAGRNLGFKKAKSAGHKFLRNISKKLKERRKLKLLPTNGEKLIKRIDNLLANSPVVTVSFRIMGIKNNPALLLTICGARPNSCTRNPLILNL